METNAKIIILAGIVITVGGLLLLLASKSGLGPFRLPGDIIIKKEGFTFYFPWVTCIVLSIIMSLIFGIIRHK
jgi:hypothetical protein